MLISDFRIMCDDCGRKYRILSDSLDVDYACSERPMGTEIQHIFYGEMDVNVGTGCHTQLQLSNIRKVHMIFILASQQDALILINQVQRWTIIFQSQFFQFMKKYFKIRDMFII